MGTLLAGICFAIAAFFLAMALRLLFMSKEKRVMYEENRKAAKLCQIHNSPKGRMNPNQLHVFIGFIGTGVVHIKSSGFPRRRRAQLTEWAIMRVWGK